MLRHKKDRQFKDKLNGVQLIIFESRVTKDLIIFNMDYYDD